VSSLGHLRRRPVPASLFVVCLAAMGAGCNPQESSEEPLRDAFPKLAAAVLERGSELARTSRGFEVIVTDARVPPRARVTLPATGEGAIAFSLAGGAEVTVREVGLSGAGEITDRAVAYDLPRGKSYWSASAGGAEEWLLLEPGAALSNVPAAVWEVAGATPVQRGTQIALHDEGGQRLITVTAPAAFLADGSKAPVRLSVRGTRIELFVETQGQAALVDPAWTYVANMNYPRRAHLARRLTDGRVLVAGGIEDVFAIPQAVGGSDFQAVSAGAESYDPFLDEWNLLPSMVDQHIEHAMVTVPGQSPPDGGVMVIGGRNDFGDVLASVESFEGQFWQLRPSLFEARAAHTATRLMDDRVLVAGGYNDCGGGSGSGVAFMPDGPDQLIGSGACFLCGVEVFDPAGNSGTGEWLGAASLSDCRALHTETLLTDGSVLVTGGEGGFGVLASSERWSPAVGTWIPVASMTFQRAHHTATALPDGRVLVTGGVMDFGAPLDTAEIYDPATDQWMPTGLMSSARSHHTASLLTDGTVLVAGGFDGAGFATANAEVFNPATGQFTPTVTMFENRAEHTASVLLDGRVLVTGGDNFFGDPPITSSTEAFSLIGGIGSPCAAAGECQSGFCVDGVCCDSVCDQPCEACTDAARGGGVSFGAPPGDPSGGSSGGDGLCGPVFYGWDPSDECADMPESTCGNTGWCDGDGACEVWNNETQCQDAGCVDNTLTDVGWCDGFGTCVVPPPVECAPFACALGACTTFCADSGDCSELSFCENAKVCVPKKEDGTKSTNPAECLSGHVADAVCCDTPCDGPCEACSVSTGGAAEGVCTPLSNVGCSDGTACTVNDVCDNGVCVPGTEVLCPGAKGCAGGVACDPTTGQCTLPIPPKKEGDSCDDGLACSAGDVCDAAGDCIGSPVPCTPGECQSSGTCVEGSGCTFENEPNYSPCTADTNPCTIEFCLDGQCLVNSVVDLTACPDGVCLGGNCIPDGAGNPSGSGGSGASGGAGGAAGGSGPGGNGTGNGDGGDGGSGADESPAAGGNDGKYALFGGACSAAGGGPGGGTGLAGLALAALGAAGLRRRRRR
jgi:MYXO-CTERM domain-containing protein